MVVHRMTPEEIDDLARKVVTNIVFLTNSEEGIENSFGMLLALSNGTIPDEEVGKIGAIWEEWSKQSPRSLNGWPIFFSAHFVHRDDLPMLVDAIEQKEKALGGVT